jgi:hypothetical protein
MRFAKGHIGGDRTDWVFCDAVTVTIDSFNSRSPKFCWQKPGVPVIVAHMQSPRTYRLYGWASTAGKDWVFLDLSGSGDTTLTSNVVCEQVLPRLKEWADRNHPNGWRLVWDHAKVHKSVRTQSALEDMHIEEVRGWPPQMQDCNMIENVWGFLKSTLCRYTIRNSNAGCRNALERAWKSVTTGMIVSCISSLDRRFTLIVKAAGEMLQGY